MTTGGIKKFITTSRVKFTASKTSARDVHISDFAHSTQKKERLSSYLADRAPLLYRDAKAISEDFEDGFFLTPIKDTLRKLPTSLPFQQSHFAEILAAVFAEEVLGLRRVYSKLSLLTSENANAYKINLLMYRPNSRPVEFVLGEVKSSHKSADEGLPSNHHTSCFADLFNSAREYAEDDYEFDLAAAKDRLHNLKEPDRTDVREALKPSGSRVVGFAGLVVIDHGTKNDKETPVLATRKSKRTFNVELLCVEKINETTNSMFSFLKKMRDFSDTDAE